MVHECFSAIPVSVVCVCVCVFFCVFVFVAGGVAVLAGVDTAAVSC